MAKPIGRPKIVIDYPLVERLAHIQCTQEEISNIMGISVDTLTRDETFCGIYKKGMESGKSSLRRLQWKGAEAGNMTMLVWLGKQYLKQTDSGSLGEREQRAKIEKLLTDTQKTSLEMERLKAEIVRLNRINEGDGPGTEDDGFIEAMKGEVKKVWTDPECSGEGLT
jgi:hypothetical protein